MKEYVITFHTHFEALVCMRALKKSGTAQAKLVPVPRALSSSCGTALRLNITASTGFTEEQLCGMEYDSVFMLCGEEYRKIM